MNPEFESLHCIAHLEQDISAVLPYLNTVLGGFEYLNNPPAWCLPHGWLKVLKVPGIVRIYQGNTGTISKPTWEGFNLKINF